MRIELMAFVTGAALACVIAPSVAQNTVVPVTIDNFVFEPARVTVKAGTTVTWTNRDDIPHTVAAKERQFKSKVMDTDESYSFTFSTPGEYTYFCSLHPHMTGTIVVEGTTGSGASQ
ncbi:MAG: cupredoxin family copper-binding protein [Bradyrhizobium sp.]|jgi:amicyanin|nr:cupredoxin family copper-binding protein [Bradyrhizobium sp.]